MIESCTGSEAPSRPASIGERNLAGWRNRMLVAFQLRSLVSQRVQQALLVAAAVFLLIGLVLSINAHPDVLDQIHWPYLLIVIAVNVPIGLGLAVIEFAASARLIRTSISIRYALFTVICGSAANMLPLPGAFIARLASLKGAGAPYRDGAYATMVANLVWLSLTFLWSGAWMIAINAELLAALLIGGGVLLGTSCLVAARWLGAGAQALLLVAITRMALIANQSASLLLCLLGIHTDAVFAQAAVLSLSAIVGSAISLVPAGFGLREGAAAVLGPIVGLSAAVGFLAAFVNRILGLMVLVPLATLLAWRGLPVERMVGNQDDVLSAQ
jgi:hypothetical protein